MVRSRISRWIVAIAAGLLLAIVYDVMRLAQDLRFNRALGSEPAEFFARSDAIHWQFAQAYALQQQGDFKAAVKAYAAIDAATDSRMHLDMKYNLANLYFDEALRFRDADDDDLAMPLVELAKQNYKEILRAEHTHWDAKYNLELALIIAPETDPIDPSGERNPERSPRAITKIRSRDSLP